MSNNGDLAKQALVAFEDLCGKPWLVKSAVEFLETIINKESLVLEIGSGSSTVWFAERAGGIVSFEERKIWFDLVCNVIADKRLDTAVVYFKRSVAILGTDAKFDICVVDARPGQRIAFTKLVLPLLKPGGYFVFDNSNHKEYKDKLKMIDDLGWRRKDFEGMGYGTNPGHPWTTTIWRKPNE